MVNTEAEAKTVTQVFEALRNVNLDTARLTHRSREILPRMTHGDAKKEWTIEGSSPGQLNNSAKPSNPESPRPGDTSDACS